MHDYIEWAEKLGEQLHQYKNQNDFTEAEIHCIREVLHAISCAYKCDMFQKESESGYSNRGSYGYSRDGSYARGRGSYDYSRGDYWQDPSYRGSYNYSNNRYSNERGYSREGAEKEIVMALEQAMPHINNRELKEVAQQCINEFKR